MQLESHGDEHRISDLLTNKSVLRTKDRIIWFLVNKFGYQDDIHDIAQDVIVKFLVNRDMVFGSEWQLVNRMNTVSRNTYIDMRRKKSKRTIEAIDQVDFELQRNSFEQYIRDPQVCYDKLWEALYDLPTNQKRIIELDLEWYHDKEIAKLIWVRYSSVRVSKSRAKIKLRKSHPKLKELLLHD